MYWGRVKGSFNLGYQSDFWMEYSENKDMVSIAGRREGELILCVVRVGWSKSSLPLGSGTTQ